MADKKVIKETGHPKENYQVNKEISKDKKKEDKK